MLQESGGARWVAERGCCLKVYGVYDWRIIPLRRRIPRRADCPGRCAHLTWEAARPSGATTSRYAPATSPMRTLLPPTADTRRTAPSSKRSAVQCAGATGWWRWMRPARRPIDQARQQACDGSSRVGRRWRDFQLTCVGVLLLRISCTGGDGADGGGCGGVFATGTSTSPAGASQSSHTDDAHEAERDAPARMAAVAAHAPPAESCMTTSAWYDESVLHPWHTYE